MMKFFKGLLIFLFLFLSFRFTGTVYALDFKADYQVEYHLSELRNNINSRVNFKIAITNLQTDVYVNKFAITFPKSFVISNLKSSDDQGEVIPNVTSDGTKTKIELQFNNPNLGRDSVNNFFLSFDQTNLFKVEGNIWEVILPVIENKDNSNYKVIVYLPENSDKKISVAKPRPDSITENQIIWNNPPTKTIYAAFGESQLYKVNLTYHLKNSNLTPGLVEVAFPPDTLYQKTYLNSINESPYKVYGDGDGNNLGQYFLKPLETKTIIADYTVQTFATPREEMVPYIRALFQKQKSYLLESQKYWDIKSLDKIANLRNAYDVYDFVVDKLSYAYSRVTSSNVRLGAEVALQKPNLAVCLEFSDLFVGISREKGIYAREVEGYGDSSDQTLRPISLTSDVLHSWPEYYNTESDLWRSVDPTWENTSGIDYFTSFDLNHVVFVIHGKKSDYPWPAGMYKTEDSKDVIVVPETIPPVDSLKINITNVEIPATVSDSKSYQAKFSVKNLGNIFLYNLPVTINGKNLNISLSKTTIAALAPGEARTINFNFTSSDKNIRKTTILKINILDKDLYSQNINIFPTSFEILIKAAISLVLLVLIFFIYKKFKNLKSS